MTDQSLIILTNSLVSETKSLLQSAKTEEELRIGFEKVLAPIINSFLN